MKPIKIDSDGWTGRDASRHDPDVLIATRDKLDVVFLALGCFSLALLAHGLATSRGWMELLAPATTMLAGFVGSTRIWLRGWNA